MAYQKYSSRKRRNNVLGDVSHIANRMPWQGCIVLGAILFVVFYYLLPIYIENTLAGLKSEIMKPVFEIIFRRRLHWLHWVGIGIGLICLFFAIRNYLSYKRLNSHHQKRVSFIGKLIAKFID